MAEEPITLNNRYRLDRLVGRGGFAQVYLALDLILGRRVAIKVLNSDLGEDSNFLARFAAEAQAVAALDHANILSVYDYGQFQEMIYLVMPYVEGGTLFERFRQRGRLGAQELLPYLRQVADALDYAHRRNLVHRDIKPQNMLLRAEDDRLLLADFGIAKALTSTSAHSRTGVMGTVSYMAPEQFQGMVGRGTDIYALGCVIFQLLTGTTPYTGTAEQIMYSHLMNPVPALAQHGIQLPAAYQTLIERALAKNPADRFESAGALARAFAAASAPEAGDLTPVGPWDAVTTVDQAGATVVAANAMPHQPNAPHNAATVAIPRDQPQPKQSPPTNVSPPTPRISRRVFIAGAAVLGLSTVGIGGTAALLGRDRNTTTATIASNNAPPSATTAPPGANAAAVQPAPSAQPAALPTASATTTSPSAAALGVAPTTAPAATAAPTTAPLAPPTATVTSLAPTATIRAEVPVPTATKPPPTTVIPTVAPPTATSAPAAAANAQALRGESLAILRGHSELVEYVDWSPDGTALASGADDDTIRFWSSAGQPVGVLRGHGNDVNSVAWASDGQRIASGSGDRTARVWKLDGTVVANLSGHTGVVTGIAWRPNSTQLATASWDTTIRLWNAEGRTIATLTGHTAKLWTCAWAANGSILASGGEDTTVRLWRDQQSGLALASTLTAHTDIVWGLDWSPTADTLASASKDGTLRLWSSGGKQIDAFNTDKTPITSVAWSPNGLALACGLYDGRVQIWGVDGRLLSTCRGHTGYVAHVAWAPNGAVLASAGQDSTVRLWR